MSETLAWWCPGCKSPLFVGKPWHGSTRRECIDAVIVDLVRREPDPHAGCVSREKVERLLRFRREKDGIIVHSVYCDLMEFAADATSHCTCGLDAAIRAVEGK